MLALTVADHELGRAESCWPARYRRVPRHRSATAASIAALRLQLAHVARSSARTHANLTGSSAVWASSHPWCTGIWSSSPRCWPRIDRSRPLARRCGRLSCRPSDGTLDGDAHAQARLFGRLLDELLTLDPATIAHAVGLGAPLGWPLYSLFAELERQLARDLIEGASSTGAASACLADGPRGQATTTTIRVAATRQPGRRRRGRREAAARRRDRRPPGRL